MRPMTSVATVDEPGVVAELGATAAERRYSSSTDYDISYVPG
jgi:hypothetical protein